MKTLDLIRKQAKEHPDRPAYVTGGASLSYRELWDHASRIAAGIRGSSAPVMIYGRKEPYMPCAMLACLMAGRAYVPADRSTPEYRVGKMRELSGCDTVIGVGAPDLGVPAIDPFSFTDAHEKSFSTPAGGDHAYIMFTSGSTGTPKGVVITRDNLDSFVSWITELEPMRGYRNAAVLNRASFCFDLSVADLYYSLCCGHTLYASENSENALEIIRENDINVAVLTPTAVKFFLLDPDFNDTACPGLRCVYFCGEQLEPKTAAKLLDRFPGLAILNAYGPTEATSAVCASLIGKEECDAPILPAGDVGTAACGVSAENGEIILSGSSVFKGYLGEAPNGRIYRTGDRGEIRGGKLYCLGRLDRQVKFKGYRVEPDDVERNVLMIDGVDDCAVTVRRGADGNVRYLRAFITGTADSDAVRKGLSLLVPDYMIPGSIVKLDSLPQNANGKIDRKALETL